MTARSYSTSQRVLRPPLADPDLVGAWTSECHGGRIVDMTPGGHNGTPTNESNTVRTILGNAQRFDGRSYIDCGSLATGIRTLEFWIRTLDANDYWFDIAAGTHFVYFTAGVIDPNGWVDPIVYVDGEESFEPNLGPWHHIAIVTATAITADNFNFGVASANYGNFEITGTNIYSAAKTQAWARARYRLGADAIQFRTSYGANETLAASEAAGAWLGQASTPAYVVSGTHRITSEAIGGVDTKVIECVTAGIIFIPGNRFLATQTEAAFGGYEFWTYKTDAGTIDVNFVTTSATALGGYTLTHAADESLNVVEVGVGNVVTGGTATAAAWHRHEITRRFDGLFAPFTDGTAWGTPTVDLTTTTSLGLLLDLDAGCKVAWADRAGGHAIVKRLGA